MRNPVGGPCKITQCPLCGTTSCEKAMNTPLQGGCHCGSIRFEISDIYDAGYCHCSICRRMSGAPTVVWANAPSKNFQILRGTPTGYRSSENWVQYFCPSCGSPVYQCVADAPQDGSDLLCILTSNLDHPKEVLPTAHIWCSARLPFFETRDELPQFQDGQLSDPTTRGPCRAA